ncbi:MAG: hypothetical protein DDT40_01477 [candidate division WS2 bacterium]|nr:hypothetical protein [Candidatus Psychracetigena formicireducens]
MITSTFITLYIVLGVSWHMYIAAGSMFVRIVGVGKYTLDVITELLNPHYAFVARISSVSPTWTLSTQILLIFNIIICLLITIGILSLFRKPEKLFNEYNALSLGFWGWFLVLAIPGFSTLAVDPGRLLLVLLLLLGPFCLSGGRIISEFLRFLPYSWANTRLTPIRTTSLRLSQFSLCYSYFLIRASFPR